MKLVIIGKPGSGKGTQSESVSNHFGIAHISTGDILRNEIKNETKVGKTVQELIKKGNFVPDDLIIQIMKQRLSKKDCEKGFIIDGFPRTLSQAQQLEKFTNIDKVIAIDISDEAVVERISGRRVCSSCGATVHISTHKEPLCEHCCGQLEVRSDGDPQTVKNRLNVFEKQTKPVIAFYEKQGKLVWIGNDSREIMFENIKNQLRKMKGE